MGSREKVWGWNLLIFPPNRFTFISVFHSHGISPGNSSLPTTNRSLTKIFNPVVWRCWWRNLFCWHRKDKIETLITDLYFCRFRPLSHSHVGDNFILVTLWWWQFFAWLFNAKIGQQHLKSAKKISKMSPTETVTNIRHQHR